MRVAVIGTGYVGLTTGVALAYIGHQVTCVDMNRDKIRQLQNGKAPFYEPHLDEMMGEVRGRMAFTDFLPEAARQADMIFLAVGTPARPDGSPDLADWFSAASETLASLAGKDSPTVLVNKSTVPAGTSDQLQRLAAKAGLASKVTVAANPEFLRQGSALWDTLYPDRIVAGGDARAVEALEELYAPIIRQSFPAPAYAARPEGLKRVPFVAVDRISAEIAKYAANAFLAMKISFINEIANVCDRVGANVRSVADIIGLDPRIGPAFLRAGIGYGGSCFPKDTKALQYIAGTSGYEFKLLSAVIEVNNAQKYTVLNKLRDEVRDLRGKKIAVLGLAFKPMTDDLREAPSIPIIHALLEEGAQVYAHDPVALEKARPLLPDHVHLCRSVHETLEGAEAALLITEWPEYLSLDPGYIRRAMKRPLWIDGRNALNPAAYPDIEYRGVGISGSGQKKPTMEAKEYAYANFSAFMA
jgi:UDPglucose 6-dehydrogenase